MVFMYNNFYKAKFVEELHFDFKNLPEINSSFDFNKTFSNYLFIKKFFLKEIFCENTFWKYFRN